MTPYGNSDLQERMKNTKNGSIWVNSETMYFFLLICIKAIFDYLKQKL